MARRDSRARRRSARPAARDFLFQCAPLSVRQPRDPDEIAARLHFLALSAVPFPGLLLLLTIMSLVGRGVPQIIVVLGVTGGIGGSRVIRGAVIGVKENVYFQAAEAIGSTKWRILIRHVLPNIAAPVIIIFTINVGGVIISEAALSFLGFGLPISVPSWGGMLSREGREFMEVAPRLALWPGLCLTIVVYCLNMFGDAVRDLLDPRLRGGGGRLGAAAARSV
ncbi:MAG: ABC transporter permease [Spirochaetaceae bacterium]|nr:ABC transporter permease [Spirochaetaceae bacterium]